MLDFSETRALFDLPAGVIYLDGNSLGPLARATPERVEQMLRQQWGTLLIRGWSEAGWMEQPRRIGDRIARLVGAAAGTVVMGDTTSIKLYQALSSALDLRPKRRVILSDTGNFPGDLYVAQGLTSLLSRHAKQGGSLAFESGYTIKCVAPEEVADALDESVAVLMLTQVDYRTARLHDMAALTAAAHDVGALAIWDLSHSAGALPVHLADCGADFAVGCTYKYLNGGPGSPAFIYVSPKLGDTVCPSLAGWMGHETPFAFDPDYRPGAGIDRMRVSTPPVIALATLDASLDIWENIDMSDIRRASMELSTIFVAGVQARCPMLELVSPEDPRRRGSHVSFAFDQSGVVMQALHTRGVIGDFRPPNMLRFGFAPLYVGRKDVLAAVEVLGDVIEKLEAR